LITIKGGKQMGIIADIAAKYGMKILGILAMLGFLTYLHHTIYQEGYDDATAKYETRDTKATAEALGILAESKRINDNNFDKDRINYESRIKDLNSKLASIDTSSVPIRTEGTQTCRETKANDTKGTGGDLGETRITELAEYNRGLLKQAEAEIDFMAKELLVCSKKVREAYDVR